MLEGFNILSRLALLRGALSSGDAGKRYEAVGELGCMAEGGNTSARRLLSDHLQGENNKTVRAVVEAHLGDIQGST